MSLASWINSAWMWASRREALAFARATRDVARTQEAVLRATLTANRDTAFGTRSGFDSIHSLAEYRRRVPLSTYETVAPYIREIAAGKDNILTSDRVELLEPTSGTTSGEKLIPYTASLRRQFQRAVAAWVADVMRHRPGVRRGRAYWSISPAFGGTRRTEGGVPIGFDDDAAYLGRIEQLLIRQLLIMPPEVNSLRTMDAFRYFTLFYLVAAEDLALISVWSPTFLTSILSPLEEWIDRICDDMGRGRLSLPQSSEDVGQTAWVKVGSPGGATPGLAAGARVRLGQRQRIRRAEELRRIFRGAGSLADRLRQVWPGLDLISCWADATAADYLPAVRELFPGVAIQPKGLLSTEACVSFPLWGHPEAALAVRSHFFEFLEWDGTRAADLRLAHELEPGRRYRVVVTTGGGLYRYQLGDVVEVTGFENQCPLIRLVGRADRVSDQVGEKLGEPHVAEVLARVFARRRVQPRFAMMTPLAGAVPGYRLYLQGDAVEQLISKSDQLAHDVEGELCENPYYRHAVEMGQLRRLDVRVLEATFEEVWESYERAWVARGRKPGQVKPAVLDSWAGWESAFEACRERVLN